MNKRTLRTLALASSYALVNCKSHPATPGHRCVITRFGKSNLWPRGASFNKVCQSNLWPRGASFNKVCRSIKWLRGRSWYVTCLWQKTVRNYSAHLPLQSFAVRTRTHVIEHACPLHCACPIMAMEWIMMDMHGMHSLVAALMAKISIHDR